MALYNRRITSRKRLLDASAKASSQLTTNVFILINGGEVYLFWTLPKNILLFSLFYVTHTRVHTHSLTRMPLKLNILTQSMITNYNNLLFELLYLSSRFNCDEYNTVTNTY